MKLMIVAVGRAKNSSEKDLWEDYLTRTVNAGRALGFASADLVEVEEKKALYGDELKSREAELLLGALPKGAFIIALDERGKTEGSEDFAKLLEHVRDGGAPALALIIGGADGLHESIRRAAHRTLSFGKATWPHMLVRVMAAEQLYRAVTILAGHPYHRA